MLNQLNWVSQTYRIVECQKFAKSDRIRAKILGNYDLVKIMTAKIMTALTQKRKAKGGRGNDNILYYRFLARANNHIDLLSSVQFARSVA